MEKTREAFDKLRQEVASGNISCDDIAKRLTVAIEVEYLKETPNIDYINTCEEFLWEINTPGHEVFHSSNQRYIKAIQQASKVKEDTHLTWGIGKRFAVIVTVFLLVFGLSQGALHFRWFTHNSDLDGEIYIIQGHEITVEIIQSALAEHETSTSLQTRSWNELCEFLGFVPSIITPEMLQAITVEYVAHIEPGLLILDIQYEDSKQNTIALLKIEYYTDPEEAYFVLQQNTQGTHIVVNDRDIYISNNVNRSSFTWMHDFTVTTLSGTLTDEQGISIVKQLTRRP